MNSRRKVGRRHEEGNARDQRLLIFLVSASLFMFYYIGVSATRGRNRPEKDRKTEKSTKEESFTKDLHAQEKEE